MKLKNFDQEDRDAMQAMIKSGLEFFLVRKKKNNPLLGRPSLLGGVVDPDYFNPTKSEVVLHYTEIKGLNDD